MTDSASDTTAALKQLIQSSQVLNEGEKHYWIDLLPTMNKSQQEQLKSILASEQEKMEKIDEKYDKKLQEVSEKYISRWDAEKITAARQLRQAEEESHQSVSEEQAEELLQNW